MSQEMKLNAELRETRGTSAARRLRRAGYVPAVLANAGGGTSLLQLDGHALELLLGRHVSDSLILTLVVDGANKLALMSEVQRSGMTGKAIHVDFHEIARDVKLSVEVPVVLLGEPDGVRNGGGVLDQNLRAVQIECLPDQVPEMFEVDITGLQVSDVLLVESIEIGDEVTMLTPEDSVIASVIAPRGASEEDAADEDAEGEEADGEDAESAATAAEGE